VAKQGYDSTIGYANKATDLSVKETKKWIKDANDVIQKVSEKTFPFPRKSA